MKAEAAWMIWKTLISLLISTKGLTRSSGLVQVYGLALPVVIYQGRLTLYIMWTNVLFDVW